MSQDGESSLLAAYQVAVDLYMNENSLTWERFNIMVTANGLLVAAAQFVIPAISDLAVIGILLPVFGLAFCHNWSRMMTRGFDYHDHWRKEAEELEAKLPEGTFHILQNATTKLRPPKPRRQGTTRSGSVSV